MTLAALFRRAAVPATALLALAATTIQAAPRPKSYELEFFDPSAVDGIDAGQYSGISNRARLAEAYDEDFAPVGVIETGKGLEVFRITEPSEGYAWCRGINDRRTTVGSLQSWSEVRVSGWMRDGKGNVSTYEDSSGDVYLFRVNNKDVAVGEVDYSFDFFRPAIVDCHGFSVVDVLGVPSDHPAYFAAINDAGAIVGGTFDPDTWEHTCLLWTRCGVTEITHDGASMVAPRAINNNGQVAGFWIEEDLDPLIGERSHGFIRDRNGRFHTVDIEFPFEDEIDFGDGETFLLVDQTIKILDMNDEGEVVVEFTGWYLGHYEFGGETYDYVLPLWTNAVAVPAGCSGHGRHK